MDPSNSTITPLVFDVYDENGNKHTLVPTPHTHSEGEVSGLTASLGNKLDKLSSFTARHFVRVKSDGTLEDAGVGEGDFAQRYRINASGGGASVTCNGIERVVEIEGVGVEISVVDGEDNYRTAEIYYDNIPNLQRALQTPDSTPTASSDKLVTSGGVKEALDGKSNVNHEHNMIHGTNAGSVTAQDGRVEIDADRGLYIQTSDSEEEHQRIAVIGYDNITNLQRALQAPDSTPTASSDKLVTSGGVKAALPKLTIQSTPTIDVFSDETEGWKMFIARNNTSSAIRLLDHIYNSGGATGHADVYLNVSNVVIPAYQYFAIRVFIVNDTTGAGYQEALQTAFVFWDGLLNYVAQ